MSCSLKFLFNSTIIEESDKDSILSNKIGIIFFPKEIAVLISSKNQSSSTCSFTLKQSLVTKRTTHFDEAIAPDNGVWHNEAQTIMLNAGITKEHRNILDKYEE